MVITDPRYGVLGQSMESLNKQMKRSQENSQKIMAELPYLGYRDVGYYYSDRYSKYLKDREAALMGATRKKSISTPDATDSSLDKSQSLNSQQSSNSQSLGSENPPMSPKGSAESQVNDSKEVSFNLETERLAAEANRSMFYRDYLARSHFVSRFGRHFSDLGYYHRYPLDHAHPAFYGLHRPYHHHMYPYAGYMRNPYHPFAYDRRFLHSPALSNDELGAVLRGDEAYPYASSV